MAAYLYFMTGNLVFSGLNSIKQAASSGGGLQYLFFTPVGNVSNFPAYVNTTGYVNQPAVTFGQWYCAVLPPTSRGYREEQKEGEGGPYFDVQVNGFLPFDSAENQLTLEYLMHERFIVMAQLANAVIKVLGDKESPCRFFQSQDTGQTIKGIPGTNIGFTWQNAVKPPILSPTDLAGLFKLLGPLAPI